MTRLGGLSRLGRFAAWGVIVAGMGVGGLTTSANAQVTKLVPLGPSQDTTPSASDIIRPREPVARVEPRPLAEGSGLGRDERESRFVEPMSAEWRTAAPQVARRVTYERPMASPWELTGETYDVRQAAYQPSTPADVAPSLNSGTVGSGTWSSGTGQGSSSGVMTTSPSSPPGFSPSPWTSSTGSTTVMPATPAPMSSSPMYVQRFSSPVPCPPSGVAITGVGVTGSVPVAQGPVGPLLPITRPPRSLYVSSGLLGQPVIYAPGQPIRNFFRYFTF